MSKYRWYNAALVSILLLLAALDGADPQRLQQGIQCLPLGEKGTDINPTWPPDGRKVKDVGKIHIKIDSDNNIELTPTEQNCHGTETLLFTATDPKRFSDSDTVTVKVISVNDNPEVTIPDISFPEDRSYALDLDDYVEDVEDPDSKISWKWESETTKVEMDSGTHVVTSSAPEDWNGEEEVIFIATDADSTDPGEGRNAVKVTVIPVIDHIPSFDIDSVLTIGDYISEDDTTRYDFSKSIKSKDWKGESSAEHIKVDLRKISVDNYVEVTFTASEDWSGEETVTLKAQDKKSTASVSSKVRVLGVNDTLEIKNTMPKAILIGTNGTFVLPLDPFIYAPGTPDSSLTWDWNREEHTGNVQIRITNDHKAIFEAPADQAYTQVEFTVTDGLETAYHTLKVRVSPIEAAGGLEETLPDTIFGVEDGSLRIPIAPKLTSADSLSWSTASGNTTNFKIYFDDKEIRIEPAPNWFGEDVIKIETPEVEIPEIEVLTLAVRPIRVEPVPDRPGPFSLLHPTSGDTVGRKTTFVWQRSIDPDPKDSIEVYELLVASDSRFSNPIIYETTPDTAFSVELPHYYVTTPLYWRVTARDNTGLERLSENTVAFYEKGIPRSFQLLSPSEGEYVRTLKPEFKWKAPVDPDADERPLHGRFSIYKHLQLFLTKKSAKIGPYFEGFCPPFLRKSSIFNMRRQTLRVEFGKLLGKRLSRK